LHGYTLTYLNKNDGQPKVLEIPCRSTLNATPGSTSSIRRVNEHVVEMTYKINGKVLYTQQIELPSDLQTLTVTRLIVGENKIPSY
jgi:uncharacterized lipoprotein YbaY